MTIVIRDHGIPRGDHARWSADGNDIYFIPSGERTGNLWALSLEDGSERALTDLDGRIAAISTQALATDGNYLYFVWLENLGDIWTMDVVY